MKARIGLLLERSRDKLDALIERLLAERHRWGYRNWRFLHPVASIVVIVVLLALATGGVVYGVVSLISNVWQSPPVTVEPMDLEVSSNWSESLNVTVTDWFEFTLYVHNPNPSTVPDYENVKLVLEIIRDAGDLTQTDGQLRRRAGSIWIEVPLSAAGGALTGNVTLDSISPGTTVSMTLSVQFLVPDTYMFRAWVQGA